jgi:hypothetical protein
LKGIYSGISLLLKRALQNTLKSDDSVAGQKILQQFFCSSPNHFTAFFTEDEDMFFRTGDHFLDNSEFSLIVQKMAIVNLLFQNSLVLLRKDDLAEEKQHERLTYFREELHFRLHRLSLEDLKGAIFFMVRSFSCTVDLDDALRLVRNRDYFPDLISSHEILEKIGFELQRVSPLMSINGYSNAMLLMSDVI